MPFGLLPFLIVNTLSSTSVAHSSIAFSITGLLYVIPDGLFTSLFAEGSEMVADLPRDLRRAARVVAALLVSAVLFLFFRGDLPLSRFGEEYVVEGFGLLRLLTIAGLFVAFYRMYIAELPVES